MYYAIMMHTPQNEDLAALAAQQYYVEQGEQMNPKRLNNMIPSVIPDSYLAGPGAQDKWMSMIITCFKKVSPFAIGFFCEIPQCGLPEVVEPFHSL